MHIDGATKRYLDAWAGRDSAGLVAAFAKNGVYCDPVSGEVRGQAIGEHAARIFSAFPDITLETLAAGAIGENMVSVHWRMPGTNTGSFHGLPPTGKPIVLHGASIITINGDRVGSSRVYFDAGAIPKQLGMQVLVQPKSLGPAFFGYSASMHGGDGTKRPTVFSLTSAQVRSDEEAEEVRGYARRLYRELGSMPGFISVISGGIGHRLFTATAWESAEGPKQVLESPVHREAVQRLMTSDWGVGAWSSIWTLARDAYWVRCPGCGEVSNVQRTGSACRCGKTLGTPPYW